MPMSRGYSSAKRLTEKDKVLESIARALDDGYAHGHFAYHLRCEIGKYGARILIFECGKAHKFVIPESEVS